MSFCFAILVHVFISKFFKLINVYFANKELGRRLQRKKIKVVIASEDGTAFLGGSNHILGFPHVIMFTIAEITDRNGAIEMVEYYCDVTNNLNQTKNC